MFTMLIQCAVNKLNSSLKYSAVLVLLQHDNSLLLFFLAVFRFGCFYWFLLLSLAILFGRFGPVLFVPLNCFVSPLAASLFNYSRQNRSCHPVTCGKGLREDFFFIVAPLSVENDPMTRAILEMAKKHTKSITVHPQMMMETCASRWLNRSRRMPCGKSTIWVTQFTTLNPTTPISSLYPTLFCRE